MIIFSAALPSTAPMQEGMGFCRYPPFQSAAQSALKCGYILPLYLWKAHIPGQFLHLTATSSEPQTKLDFPWIHAGLRAFLSRLKGHFSCPVTSMLRSAGQGSMPFRNGSYPERTLTEIGFCHDQHGFITGQVLLSHNCPAPAAARPP